MPREDMIMPQLGESVAEGTILKWLKKVGDNVAYDEMILEISTDKIDSEIPAPIAGVLAEILVEEGDTVPVRTVIARIETDISQPSSVSIPVGEDQCVLPESKVDTLLNDVAISENKGEHTGPPLQSKRTQRFFSPLVKRIAKENNISLEELENISGSGVGGRINRQDIEKYIASSSASSGEVTKVVPMDSMRKTIAKHMVASKKISPHVMSVHEVDMSAIVAWREQWKDHFYKKHGFKLTYTPIVLHCVVQALKEFPWINASIQGDNVIEHRNIHLSMAVALKDGGLIVPVIKNAQHKNLINLCQSVQELSEKSRNKKLVMSDLEGGTFTVTNAGVFGTIMGYPIINQPQVAILAMNAIVKRPVVVDGDAIAIRSMMYFNMSYDHRIVDGMMAGRFLQRLCQLIAEFDVSGEP